MASQEATTSQERALLTTKALQDAFGRIDLQLLSNVSDFTSHKADPDDTDEDGPKDPAIIADEVASQMSFLRKLKFQYVEQNAKDKYIKSIVSDIDDAPIVTADDNKKLATRNEEKKARLRVSKDQLAEVQRNVRLLAPEVEADYEYIKSSTAQAAVLAQKIIDARLALTRLRQTHPQPRLTIPLAEKKLADQDMDMQTLDDDLQDLSKRVQTVKARVKGGASEAEKLRAERAEVEKVVRVAKVDEDDARLAPLYDWYTASLSLHELIYDLHESRSVSDNELQLTYAIDPPSSPDRRKITIALVFAPDTHQLAAAQVSGTEAFDVDLGDLIEAHLQIDDVHALVAAVLQRIRAAVGVVR